MASEDWVYKVPASTGTAESEVKGSQFIATMGRAESADAARRFIHDVAARYSDASHNAWAFKITDGPQAEIASSDDGEPGGTAGRPMLAVLSGSDVRQVVVVGTRYFGGTKLGTGGLVRAYAGVARQALKALPTRVCRLYQLVSIVADYNLYGSLKYVLPKHGVRTMDERFGEHVEMDLALPFAESGAIGGMLAEMSNGSIDVLDSVTGTVFMEDDSST